MMVKLGLKSSANFEQLQSRLKYKPTVFEFHTSEQDFTKEGLKVLEEGIQLAKASGVQQIVLHHPMFYKGQMLELVAKPSIHKELVTFIDRSTENLLDLAYLHDCQVLVHGSYEIQTQQFLDDYSSLVEATDFLWQKLDAFQALGKDKIMFENSISPLFYFGEEEMDKQIYARNYRLAYDVSHAFIKLQGNQTALEQSLAFLREHIVHYHLVDSMEKEHDSLTLGQGKIDWAPILPLLNPSASSIYEIHLADLLDPKEQLESHSYLEQLKGLG
ncbi:TPA: sugar phosphate isomerase/epimerase [Streptococcus suis]|uniref:sugar phosphate isomerase/epimerase n=1 Tax=Streptococcus suis TaxID=1307 RepID=UPI002AA2B786|nr:sugar phosphate isomerase/epimerase [Streptococcus suis]